MQMPDRHVGFTGTRQGMTTKQVAAVAEAMRPFDWLHHGDCLGADAEAHRIAVDAGLKTAGHLPISRAMRAFCKFDVIHEPKDYLTRNHDIVDATEAMIAAPKSRAEDLRSGTWATIRYARVRHKWIIIVWPNGAVSREGFA